MGEEICVSEYVRTNDGHIGKFDYISKDGKYLMLDIQSLPLEYCEVKKHSKNIIDVLEVGDIVELKIGDDWYDLVKIVDKEILGMNIMKKPIRSVMTYEQYEANCYRLEE